ncbi:hypothetical protein KKD19_00675 [Patescibacteria group bacterium]|nr:hypothetical protein [Patescibacteria group bacterium]MBU4511746.1 hypothetical protein [Patescibacteria group bacterium]
MRYYVLTTTKFADQCLKFQTYGSTNSNWLSNIELGDIVFISQFNYKSQDIYGPFKVFESLFYDKKIIYPEQKYYYRIKIKPINLKSIEETDLYLQGIKNKNINFAFQLINLIQQNKHLHSISLTEEEGKFLLKTIDNYGKNIKDKKYDKNYTRNNGGSIKVDLKFLKDKNRLFKKSSFSSESDLESYIMLSLKNKNNKLFKDFSEILNSYPKNNLPASTVYNQFIFGNAYPSDIVIINDKNTNIFELKKDHLSSLMLEMIKREFKKYCYYSLYSRRLAIQEKLEIKRRTNFFLVVLKQEDQKFHKTISNEFKNITKPINNLRENNFNILEYYIANNELTLATAIKDIKNYP